ncbi:T9SS type A sorting domain-containing protein [Marivirga sp.]|uniref:T9SS type A sorting domain-containing protein n=1 Tax=Marivirga sp. TaxID=2018662 RepID=UPI002D7F3F2D|nr:T9SS type A sorting domain-containing protein [Marivirga sp.]HET8861297.1 T9SS type A sorting domain-containing protein [Marivirga sp.]
MNKNYILTIISCLLITATLYLYVDNQKIEKYSSKSEAPWSTKKSKVKAGKEAYMKPDGFIKYYNNISKKIDAETSEYKAGYRYKELTKSFRSRRVANQNVLNAQFKSRGPGNVGGRTRAIAIDPDDASKCTWTAGAASGGIWRTTDCGKSWENLSPDLPNLSTNSIAQSKSNPDILYVGTGEVFAGNSTFVRGDGIYKSIDRGNSWSLLPSTVSNNNFLSVNRIQVDPKNADILTIATNTGVFKSSDGGLNWIQTYDAPGNATVQDLQVDPQNYNIQYAGVNSTGIIKSVNAGNDWALSSNGIGEGVRFEIAVSPSNPAILYTSTYQSIPGPDNDPTILYYSDDRGQNWYIAAVENYNTSFLGEQGWYDNSIAVNPYDPYEVFIGGVSIGKFNIDPTNISETERTFLGIEYEGQEVINLVSFEAGFNNGTLEIGSGSNSPSNNPVSIEVRFGGDNMQKAHRFTIPAGETAGVPISNYKYEDYQDVPFEVWDVEANRQLMVSYRDQENDGIFDLNKRSQTDENLSAAREYIYIHDVEYDPNTPTTEVAMDGGIEYANMYFFWPVLSESAVWEPANFSTTMNIVFGTQTIAASEASAVYDAYGDWENQNRGNLHPDHHHLTLVPMNDNTQQFMIVNGNDGGFGISTNSGEVITQLANGYVTTQFYGADKKPGEEKYIGGMQDNGTWISSGTVVDETNPYNAVIGGDGFEVIWHATDPQKVIGGFQFNGIRRSLNGGQLFSDATSGITEGPFITRLVGSVSNPDVIYAIGETGVYKSNDFGGSWQIKLIDNPGWLGENSASDVEVSLANDQIVWAGAGMAGEALSLFVSTDAGESFNAVNDYSRNPSAFYTGIYTHPTEENTAYALFSRANFPKILKTTDLGQTWEDISGFDEGSQGSNRGFPDVFVHSLLVMPFNTDILWAGTEIGLYESLDGGQTWNIRNDFPSVSIWSMKIVDDQVVIGTHGRGIWTAETEELRYTSLKVTDFSYSGYGNAEIKYNLPVEYSTLKLLLNDQEEIINTQFSVGSNSVQINDFFDLEPVKLNLRGTYLDKEYTSQAFKTPEIDFSPILISQESSGDKAPLQIRYELENNEPYEKVEILFNNEVVHTDQQILTESEPNRVIEFEYNQIGRNDVTIRGYLRGNVYTTTVANRLITSNSNVIQDEIKIYPNPATDFVNVNSAHVDFQILQVYSTNGVLVRKYDLKSDNNEINISDLESGIYLFQLQAKNGRMISKRIIKQ